MRDKSSDNLEWLRSGKTRYLIFADLEGDAAAAGIRPEDGISWAFVFKVIDLQTGNVYAKTEVRVRKVDHIDPTECGETPIRLIGVDGLQERDLMNHGFMVVAKSEGLRQASLEMTQSGALAAKLNSFVSIPVVSKSTIERGVLDRCGKLKRPGTVDAQDEYEIMPTVCSFSPGWSVGVKWEPDHLIVRELDQTLYIHPDLWRQRNSSHTLTLGWLYMILHLGEEASRRNGATRDKIADTVVKTWWAGISGDLHNVFHTSLSRIPGAEDLRNGSLKAGLGMDLSPDLVRRIEGRIGETYGMTVEQVNALPILEAAKLLLEAVQAKAKVQTGERATTNRARPADERRDLATASMVLRGKIESNDFDVFLCHNSKDKPAVKAIGEALKAQGILPWLDEWNLRPGFPWVRALEEQIKNIKAAAVFVGPDGIGPWQDMEQMAFIRQFVKRRCPVIPVILPNCTTVPELPTFLEDFTWVDFRKDDPDPIEQLIWGITGEQGESRAEHKMGTS